MAKIHGFNKVMVSFFAFTAMFITACNNQKTDDWTAEQLRGEVKHIKTTAGRYEEINDLTYTEEIFFDRHGLKTHAITLDEYEQYNLQCLYEHDKFGNITLADMRDADNNPIMKNVFEFDERGNMLKMESIDADNHADLTILYKNDSFGRQIQQSIYDYLGRIVRVEQTEYIDNDKPTELKKLSRNILVNERDTTTSRYYYDEKNQLVLQTDSSADYITRFEYEYDEYGNCIYDKMIFTNSQQLRHTKYKYDNIGNWTEKIVYHVDSAMVEYPTFIWNREIEYY